MKGSGFAFFLFLLVGHACGAIDRQDDLQITLYEEMLEENLGLAEGMWKQWAYASSRCVSDTSNHTYIFLDKVALLCCGLP